MVWSQSAPGTGQGAGAASWCPGMGKGGLPQGSSLSLTLEVSEGNRRMLQSLDPFMHRLKKMVSLGPTSNIQVCIAGEGGE